MQAAVGTYATWPHTAADQPRSDGSNRKRSGDGPSPPARSHTVIFVSLPEGIGTDRKSAAIPSRTAREWHRRSCVVHAFSVRVVNRTRRLVLEGLRICVLETG